MAHHVIVPHTHKPHDIPATPTTPCTPFDVTDRIVYAQLIMKKEIKGRIDSHNKIIFATHADQVKPLTQTQNPDL